MTFTYLCFLLSLHVIAVTSAGEWCYEPQNSCSQQCLVQREWTDIGSCAGKEQSPINIVTRHTKYKDLKPFKFSGYDAEKEFEFKNNGHSVELEFNGAEITISEGGLEGTYKASQLHFHWGSSDMSGSEHTVDGVRYAAELHIVHTLQSRTSARAETGGTTGRNTAVLGFFIEETSSDNSKYKNLIDALSSLRSKDNHTSVSKVILKELLPENLEHFYRYEGSLTTPPCSEIVTWTVFSDPVKLGINQLQAFYNKLNYSSSAFMVENFRPTQKLGDRTVYTSGVEAILSHSRLLLLSFIVAFLVSTS